MGVLWLVELVVLVLGGRGRLDTGNENERLGVRVGLGVERGWSEAGRGKGKSGVI